MTESNLFEGKNVHVYQKKNAPQDLPPLIEQMSEAISIGKYRVVVMANLEGAFDGIYKLCEASISSKKYKLFDVTKFILVFPPF